MLMGIIDYTGSSPAQALSHGDRDDETWGVCRRPSPPLRGRMENLGIGFSQTLDFSRGGGAVLVLGDVFEAGYAFPPLPISNDLAS